jgi:hypothetical protein
MMAGNPGLDNGEWMMRAQREYQADPYRRMAQQLAREAAQQIFNAHLTPQAWTAGERPEPEDTTGLKMLEEFLAKRRRARDD